MGSDVVRPAWDTLRDCLQQVEKYDSDSSGVFSEEEVGNEDEDEDGAQLVSAHYARAAADVPWTDALSVLVLVSHVASAERHRNPFTVDDGTGTVECTFRLDQDAQGGRASMKQDTRFQEPSNNRSSSLIPVGSVVRVQGRVRAKRNSREVYCEPIGPSIPTLVLERPF